MCQWISRNFSLAVNWRKIQMDQKSNLSLPWTSTHKCNVCSKTFTELLILKSHIRRLHFQCEICDLVCWQFIDLITHLSNGHGKEVEYKCEICDKSFINFKVDRWQHMKEIHDKNRYWIKKLVFFLSNPKVISNQFHVIFSR